MNPALASQEAEGEAHTRMPIADCRSLNRDSLSNNKNPRVVSNTRVVILLLAEAETLDRIEVRIAVRAGEVAEQAVTLGDHHDEAAAVVHVLLVVTQVGCDLLDAGGQKSDLYFWTTGVPVLAAEVFYDL